MKHISMRQRMLAVLRGGELDRVPFVQYDGLAGPTAEIWNAIGRENMGLLRWTSAHAVRTPNCRFDEERFVGQDGLQGIRYTLHTPRGNLIGEKLIEPAMQTAATRRHFIRDLADYEILLAYLRDLEVVKDLTQLHRNISELGEDGMPLLAVLRTPFQQLWIQWVCLEDLCWHMSEAPDLLAEVLTLLGDIERRVMRIVRDAADEAEVPYVDFPDNITAPVTGAENFRRYCLPYYAEMGELLADKGIPVAVHMDGDLKPFWTMIGESRIGAIDSFSPPPDNDTSVRDAVRMWPRMRVLLNFPSSVHIQPPERIYRATRDILEQGGHTGRIWIQISENLPPDRWRASFPAIVRAIQDFGKP
jgi:hypothetical protein